MLGREALQSLAASVRWEVRFPRAGAVDKLQALLLDGMGEEGLLETHALHDFDSVSADVDLQTGQTEVRKLLEDGNIVLLSCEPESEGVAG